MRRKRFVWMLIVLCLMLMMFWISCLDLFHDFPICSGDAKVQTSQALEALFVNSGDNPYELIKHSIKYVFFFSSYY